jgi:hypothetical protein
VTQHAYEGPAFLHLNCEELLIIWSVLHRIPNAENAPIRRKIEKYLETKGHPIAGGVSR